MVNYRSFINRNPETINYQAIQDLQKSLQTELSPQPWSPKSIIQGSHLRPKDIEFISLSPSIVNKLCEFVLYLLEYIDEVEVILQKKKEEHNPNTIEKQV
jgi:hypothetical protein